MKITEGSIPDSTRESLIGAAGEGAEIIGVSLQSPPTEIVKAINAFVAKPPKKWFFSKIDNWSDRALPLGCLWGLQLVREFDWEWTSVTFHGQGGSKAIGVFSKNRSIGVYPFEFIFGCLENQAPVTIMLAFNMLSSGKIPDLPPGEFQNLMDGVHHIVPPV